MGRRAEDDLVRSSGLGLSNLLARRDSSLMLVSICMMATAMTTTLIGVAYDNLASTGRFCCRAWVTVPHPFNLDRFLRSLLRQFLSNDDASQEGAQESIETMGAPQLIRSLSQNLQHKTHLLVIDDVSSREEWDSINLYLRPDVRNASRIIVTSQREDVARYCAGGLRSSSFCIPVGTAVFSAFCNMVIESSISSPIFFLIYHLSHLIKCTYILQTLLKLQQQVSLQQCLADIFLVDYFTLSCSDQSKNSLHVGAV